MSSYHIKNLEEYYKVYRKSIREPELFWEEIAEEHFNWYKKWDKVLSWDFKKPEVKWFDGAKLNITENCIDRHLRTRGNKTAIIFEPNNPDEEVLHITYKELYERVNRLANVLTNKGIKKGDRICIYLPMIPELAVSVLACARIGAIHSVVFAGFSATALATRINDSGCKMVLTSDGSYRGNKTIDLKGIVDEAVAIVRKPNRKGRNVRWADEAFQGPLFVEKRELIPRDAWIGMHGKPGSYDAKFFEK